MNDYTAKILRAELNRERFHLEKAQEKVAELDMERSQQAQWIRENEQRIADLTEELEAAGASTEPWPDAFTQTPAATT